MAAAGGRRLVGVYRPTAKNGLVRDFYPDHGFRPLEEGAAAAGDDPGASRWILDLGTDPPAWPDLIRRADGGAR